MAIDDRRRIVSIKKGDRGESAYQIAVRNGFTGTERQWLASLKGTDGTTPVKGSDYNDGVTPIKGVHYFDGKEVEFRVINQFIQWRYAVTGTWINLLPLSLIKGEPGKTPQKGVDYFDGTPLRFTDLTSEQKEEIRGLKGDPGDSLTFDMLNTNQRLQLKGDKPVKDVDYSDGQDGEDGRDIELQSTASHIQWRYVGDEWENLLSLEEIKGPPGNDSTIPGPAPVKGVDYFDGLPGSDATVTKEAVESVLTGVISTHSHEGGGLTQAQILTRQI